jgi:hypothetical protein
MVPGFLLVQISKSIFFDPHAKCDILKTQPKAMELAESAS